jgi:hypothetical protein
MTDTPTNTDEPRRPDCELIGTDGNVFAIIGAVSRALRRDGQRERATEWAQRAMTCESYDAVLALTFEYVEPF